MCIDSIADCYEGMGIESKRIRDWLASATFASVASHRVEPDATAEPPSYGASFNPFPALVIGVTGAAMAAHAQTYLFQVNFVLLPFIQSYESFLLQNRFRSINFGAICLWPFQCYGALHTFSYGLVRHAQSYLHARRRKLLAVSFWHAEVWSLCYLPRKSRLPPCVVVETVRY